MKKKIALVILSEPMIFPPTINAANILADQNFEVFLVGIKHQCFEKINLNPGIKMIYFDRRRTGLFNLLQYVAFYFWFPLFLLRKNIYWTIAYEAFSIGPVALSSFILKRKWIYHQHDYWENPKGWYKLVKAIENKYASWANYVSFPQEIRAKKFKEIAKLKEDPYIVYNGPRRNWCENILPNPKILEIKKDFSNILIYQGGWSKNFSLETVLNGLTECKTHFAFLILGKELENEIKDFYQNQIEKFKLENKVFLIGEIEYNVLPSFTKYSTIGIANFTYKKESSVNNYYLAGASNKLSEYLSCGLPIIAPDTPSNREFVISNNMGIVCDPANPSSVAAAIDLLLSDTVLYEQIKNNNLRLFNLKYNYDIQFEKVLKAING